jgi:hypothetical protein
MPHPASAYVRFDRVRRSFDGVNDVVRDLSLDVARGEFLTLLGPSGSGKTTTLMMLAGFEQPDAGEILLDGQSITRLAPHRRNIGVVFQSFALFPHMTVAENVAFPLSVRGLSRAAQRERVGRALEMVRLAWRRVYPRSFPAASSSAWRSPAPWCSSRAWCCSTSRSAHWTAHCARRCRPRFATCTPPSASPWSMSRMTRPKRCACRTVSP